MSHEAPQFSSEIFKRKPYLQKYFPSQEDPSQRDIIRRGEEEGFRLHPAREPEEYYVSFQESPLASQFSPRKQAERQIQEIKIHERDVVVLLGAGNPELVRSVHSLLRSEQIFLVMDSSASLVPLLWESCFAEILAVPGRHVFCGTQFVELGFTYLESLPIERLKGIKVLRNPADLKREPHFFTEIEKRLGSVFSAKMSDLLTKFEFERLWVKNSLWNLTKAKDSFPMRMCISDLENLLQGLPAILISAGPSLRSSLPYLQKVRDKAFFLSCDTSLKVLLKAGILPDGVVTLDAQTNSFFHFMGEDLLELPLFADLVTSPSLLREGKFSRIVHSVTAKYQTNAEGQWVREVTAGGEFASEVLGPVGDIQSGGSVATTAFDILRFLGAGAVHFVGQDLAYSGREIHSTGTHHNEKWLCQLHRRCSLEWTNEVIIRKRETRFVDSCDGGSVLTDYVLDLYRHWFEESAKSVSLPLYNWNVMGAYIKGFQNLAPREAVSLLLQEKDHGYPWKNRPPWKEKIPEIPRPMARILLARIFREMEDLETLLKEWETSPEEEVPEQKLYAFLAERPYLNRMMRKTEIYILRHPELPRAKRSNLFCQGLRKEIRYVRRGLYPIKEEESSNG